MTRKPMCASLLALSCAAAAAAPPARTAAEPTNRVYLVQLAEPPAVAYAGGSGDLAATRPAAGRKIDPESPAVRRYLAHLRGRHETLLRSVGGGRKLYSYGIALNGFAAELTPAQARRLERTRGVSAVEKDRAQRLATSFTPGYLGLTGSSGFWSSTGATGEGVVIGVIDTGIWPEHPSVAAAPPGQPPYAPIRGWRGACVPGEDFTEAHCNRKLIGARYFNAGWGGNAGIDALFPGEYNSARDPRGHGTHTATIAGGNAGVPVTGVLTTAETVGAVLSGIAPRARIAVYKASWGDLEGSSFSSDLAAAVDQAVADGVDVINYSITGARSTFNGAVSVAMRHAAGAGVFIAAAAGNDGLDGISVGNIAPWLTTVAASTHAREARGLLTLGDGRVLTGRSAPRRLPAAPLIDARAAGLPGADPLQLASCFGASDGAVVLDPARVAGRIVLCDRGESDRVAKSRAVREAGGVGMVLLNVLEGDLLYADLHEIPSVHLFSQDRAAVKAYAARPGATAAIVGEMVFDAASPYTAFFSSRGPAAGGGGDLMKPDLAAPGHEVVAGVAPYQGDGVLYYLYSGTSMATPHVAGLGALLRQLHPDWSPMAIKSALMTTGTDLLDDTDAVSRLHRQGAGHVQPLRAADPGLVFDAGPADWLAFLCGVGQPATAGCIAGRHDPSDLNGASIAIGALAGVQTVQRRLRNVGAHPSTFSVSISGLAGIGVTVEPPALVLAPGQTAEVAIRFSRDTATFGSDTAGQLSWSDGRSTVRVPMLVRPVALAAPVEVAGSYRVQFGYSGAFGASGRGPVPAEVTPGSVADDPSDSACSLQSPNAVQIPVTLPPGTSYARFALFDADVNPGSDLDLCVFRGDTLMGVSAGATAAEQVSLDRPAPGPYTVVVQGWGVDGTTPFRLHGWVLGSRSGPLMDVVAPASAELGATGTIRLRTRGLQPGLRYLGSVAYDGIAGLPGPTLVRLDP